MTDERPGNGSSGRRQDRSATGACEPDSTAATPLRLRPAEPGDVEVLHRFVVELPAAEQFPGEVAEEPVGFAPDYPSYSTVLGRPGIHLEDLYVCGPPKRRNRSGRSGAPCATDHRARRWPPGVVGAADQRAGAAVLSTAARAGSAGDRRHAPGRAGITCPGRPTRASQVTGSPHPRRRIPRRR